MLVSNFIHELQHEAVSTRKMLERIPADQMGWAPHEKSMTLGDLALHLAEIPSFASHIMRGHELDLQSGAYGGATASDAVGLVQLFDHHLSRALNDLREVEHNDDVLQENWTLRAGDHIVFELPRLVALRTLAFSHLIHHRGQLSVYLRLLNIPVPSIYGPSADEAA